MRRAFLLFALALPAIAVGDIAATTGQLLDFQNYSANPTYLASFVNEAMCNGTATLQLEWALNQQPAQTGTYTLYASNVAPKAATDGTGTFCATQDDPNTTPPTKAGQIATGTQVNRVQRNTSISGADAVKPSNFTCGSASENQVFYICAHFAVGSTRTDSAIGKFVIQVAKPEPPTNVNAAKGPSQLTVSWTAVPAGTGTVAADRYVAQATPVDDSGTPTGDPVFSSSTNGESVTINNLTNGQLYRVSVKAFSIGGNESALVTAAGPDVAPTPVDDFWKVYKNDAGQEQGGCGAGGAGPVALLAVAALLGALRRRK